MRDLHAPTKDEIADLERHLRDHLPPTFASDTARKRATLPSACLGQPLAVWRIPRRLAQPLPLEDLARHDGEWLFPIQRDSTIVGTLRASRTPDLKRPWAVHSLTVDQQLGPALAAALGDTGSDRARLVEQGSTGIMALWLLPGHQNEHLRVVSKHLSRDPINKEAFLYLLGKHRAPTGPIGPRPKPPLMHRLRNQRWGVLTMVALIGLVIIAFAIRQFAGQVAKNATATYNLTDHWLTVQALLLSLCIGAGYAARGRPFGILIDDRNRYSLARFQWLIWFTAIFGGYFTEALWNVGQGLPLPTLSSDVLKLLGLVTLTPVLSATIVGTKKAAPNPAPLPSPAPPPGTAPGSTFASLSTTSVGGLPTPAPPPGQPDQVGKIDVNTSPRDAGWQDLYLGEEVANRDVVDVSRLQQLVATVLVVSVYYGDLSTALTAAKAGAQLALPTIGSDMVNLLGLSQAGYLAYKAVPKS